MYLPLEQDEQDDSPSLEEISGAWHSWHDQASFSALLCEYPAGQFAQYVLAALANLPSPHDLQALYSVAPAKS
jgi:hypothetical protein